MNQYCAVGLNIIPFVPLIVYKFLEYYLRTFTQFVEVLGCQ